MVVVKRLHVIFDPIPSPLFGQGSAGKVMILKEFLNQNGSRFSAWFGFREIRQTGRQDEKGSAGHSPSPYTKT